MGRMIFVNLPVRDLESSKRFFSSLGFGFDARFSDDKAACLVIDDGHSYVMLLVEEFFRTFITTDIADTAHATEVLTCLSCASRDEVDELVAKAIAAGGKPWKPVMDEGPMHGGSFQDIDGHVWEVLHMDPSGIPAA